ncbi:protein rep [Apilactobacillus timberlakei]|uniref:protein rep n=1 Tax=Apilactobacillus timberlakei TaxID=2008380 RepID=UPI00112DCBA9|nr:protein rep [Apilactobacillus timberlakei]TPR16774.1 protein rep [Apilactobacillus timberlakei]TPR18583.1 protein rep [Apilactobacillus timberlakei]TPR20433.1 protein rep [Apilactobacillus timberlakei]
MTERKVFKDLTRNGSKRPWRRNKLDNLTYAEYLLMLHYRKAAKVKECGNVLRFKKAKDGSLKLYQTWFCKSRLCPLCAWRRSMKNSNQLIQILNESHKEYPKGRFLFLTLSTKNTYSDNLNKELRHYGTAFNRMINYKKISKNLLGYVRSTEITVNHDDGSYNQHMHILLFVSSRYFKDSDNYISQAEWTKYWRKAMKLDYQPMVNVEAVHPSKSKNDLLAGVKETAKYQVKSADYITDDEQRDLQVTDDLEQALSHTRAISYGKLFKTIRKKLQLEDEDDLVNTDDPNEDSVLTDSEIVVAKWNYELQNYFIS